MRRGPLEITVEYTRRYLPVVLLMVWVVASYFIRWPWAGGKMELADGKEKEAGFEEVLLLSGPQEKLRTMAYEAVVISKSSAWAFPQDIVLYIQKDTALRYEAGDVVLIKAHAEGERAYVPSGHSALINHRSTAEIGWTEGKLRIIALRARERLEMRLESYMQGEEEVALTESLLLGDRRQLNADQRDAFSDAGAMHVLAVSGLHVGIIAGIIMWLLTLGNSIVIRWENYRLRRAQRWLAIGMIWGYAFLTGMSVSVVRSAIMFSLLPPGKLHKETPAKYNRLAAAALLILVLDPRAISSASFVLSFSAVLSIMYFMPRWRVMVPKREGKTKWQRKLLKARGYMIDLVLMSVAAQIGTLPFTLLFFGQSSNYFLLTNVLVLPLAGLVLMPLGIAALASSLLPQTVGPIGWLTSALMRLTELSAEWMNASVRLVQQLPGATSYFTFTPLMAAALCGFIVSLSAFVRLRGWGRYVALGLVAICMAVVLAAYGSKIIET